MFDGQIQYLASRSFPLPLVKIWRSPQNLYQISIIINKNELLVEYWNSANCQFQYLTIRIFALPLVKGYVNFQQTVILVNCK